jgi:hypothetical protein
MKVWGMKVGLVKCWLVRRSWEFTASLNPHTGVKVCKKYVFVSQLGLLVCCGGFVAHLEVEFPASSPSSE